MNRYSLVAALCLVPLAAYAQDPKACAALSEDKARLECYDLANRKTANVTTSSKWLVREEKSRLDDSREVFLAVSSMVPIRGKFGQAKHGEMYITCRDKTTNIYFVFGDHFMSSINGNGKVSARVDANTPKTLPMTESTDHHALGLWGSKTAVPYIKDLIGGQSLYVRAVPFSESAIEMDFPIAGLAEAIKPLREACAW